MEFVPLSDTVLRYLAKDDHELRPYFRGVFPADQVPLVFKKRVNACIVNTDFLSPTTTELALNIVQIANDTHPTDLLDPDRV